MITEVMREFVAGLATVVESAPDDRERAVRTANLLGPLLDRYEVGEVLAPDHTEPDPNGYRPHLVEVGPGCACSVVVMVWPPGQCTPIHDHRCWCAVGVLTGREETTSYQLDERGHLVPDGTVVHERGTVTWLAPPARAVHQVRNVGTSVAISLPVYGVDIRTVASSVNTTYLAPTPIGA
jgi:predicted metal-dependent enzyme (double-stranded beta helix superfamily)